MTALGMVLVRHGSVDRGGLERAAFLSDPLRPRNAGIHAPNQLDAAVRLTRQANDLTSEIDAFLAGVRAA